MIVTRKRTPFAALFLLPLLLVATDAEAWPASGAEVHDPAAHLAEVRRIQVKQDSVLAELRGRDVSTLTASQRSKRAQVIETFARYVARGEFPHNYDFPGAAVPYFVDRKTAVVCAFGHLLESTGHRALVDRIARTNNNVLVRDLADDPEVGAWLDEHGVTLAEAARIQVPYLIEEAPPAAAAASSAARGANVAGLAVGASGALYNVAFNRGGTSRLGAFAGLAAGAITTGIGAGTLGRRDVPRAMAASNVALGVATGWLSARAFGAHRRLTAARRAVPAVPSAVGEADATSADGASAGGSRLSFAPVLPVDGRSGTGLSLSLRF